MKRYKLAMLSLSMAILLVMVVYAKPLVLLNLLVKSNYIFILLGFSVAFLSIILGVLKWKVLLNSVGFAELFPVQLLGWTISNFSPGKAAEPVKAVLLKMVKGTDVSSSLASIIWERITDVISLVLFSLLAISTLSVASNFFLAGLISLAVFCCILLVSFSVLYNRGFGIKFFNFIRKLPVLKRLPKNFMELFYKVRIEKIRIIKCFLIALATWGMQGVILYFSLGAFGVQINPIILSGIVAFSVVIGIASSLPGGLGTTEVVMAFLLGLNSVESSVAIASAIVFRFMTIWFVNFLGGVSFLYLNKKFEIKNII